MDSLLGWDPIKGQNVPKANKEAVESLAFLDWFIAWIQLDPEREYEQEFKLIEIFYDNDGKDDCGKFLAKLHLTPSYSLQTLERSYPGDEQTKDKIANKTPPNPSKEGDDQLGASLACL